jgi:ParB family chromosome partitioning protein
VEQGLSVRQAEALAARLVREPVTETTARPIAARDPHVAAAEQELQRWLGTKVSIVQDKKGRGKVEVHFFGDEELQRVFQLLRRASRAG